MLLEDHDTAVESAILRDIRLSVGEGCSIEDVAEVGPLTVITIRASRASQITLQAPLGDVDACWFPNMRSQRGIPAGWDGNNTFSAVHSAPIAALYDIDGISGLAFALDALTREGDVAFGVAEETMRFVMRFTISENFAGRVGVLRLAIHRDPVRYDEALAALRRWLDTGLPRRNEAIPDAAAVPVYSTWYAFLQQISAEAIEREAEIASALGFGAVFIDDGWQLFGDGRWYTGCGDWQPDPEKFPDLRQHVDRLHELGLSVVLWIAPLVLGHLSSASEQLGRFAPHYVDGLRAAVLDPRHSEVRRHVIDTCVRLVRDYGLDGLKIDFLNDVMVYAGTPSTGDIDDVGVAMVRLLDDLELAFASMPTPPVIEFRQPYMSPAVARFASAVRAADCPADAIENRRSVIDLRLVAGRELVHTDPMTWDPGASPEGVARQLLNGFFGVPQISMRLAELPESHKAVIAAVLARWTSVRDVVLRGILHADTPSESFPIVSTRLGDDIVFGVFQPYEVTIERDVNRATLVNATRQGGVHYRSTAAGRTGIVTIFDASGNQLVHESVQLGASGEIPVPSWGVAVLELR